MESIQGRLDAMEQRDILRDLLEDKGLRMSDLDSSQRKLLLKQDEEDMSTLLESMNLTGKQTPPEQTPPKTKPNVRPVRESNGGTYDQALKEAKGST